MKFIHCKLSNKNLQVSSRGEKELQCHSEMGVRKKPSRTYVDKVIIPLGRVGSHSGEKQEFWLQ